MQRWAILQNYLKPNKVIWQSFDFDVVCFGSLYVRITIYIEQLVIFSALVSRIVLAPLAAGGNFHKFSVHNTHCIIIMYETRRRGNTRLQ